MIQEMLRERDGCASFDDISRELRHRGRRAVPDVLRTILGDSSVFLLRAGDEYCLRDFVEKSLSDDYGPDQHEADPVPQATLTLSELPLATSDYVVLDVETTGLDSQRDRVIQVTVLRVLDGEPVELRNWYLNPGAHVADFGHAHPIGP